jgi:hypothetical protein
VSPRAVDPALLLLLVPLQPPPRKGWIFMAFCAFCVGSLWILGVLCAWDYLHWFVLGTTCILVKFVEGRW